MKYFLLKKSEEFKNVLEENKNAFNKPLIYWQQVLKSFSQIRKESRNNKLNSFDKKINLEDFNRSLMKKMHSNKELKKKMQIIFMITKTKELKLIIL